MVKAAKIAVILLMILLLTSCSNFLYQDGVQNNDWSYSLKNGYEISHINGREIVCGKRNSEHTTSIDIEKFISKFYYNDEIACLQYLEVFDLDYKTKTDDEFKYATINFDTDEIKKYDSLSEFLEDNQDKEIIDIKDWTNTKPRPEGARFD